MHILAGVRDCARLGGLHHRDEVPRGRGRDDLEIRFRSTTGIPGLVWHARGDEDEAVRRDYKLFCPDLHVEPAGENQVRLLDGQRVKTHGTRACRHTRVYDESAVQPVRGPGEHLARHRLFERRQIDVTQRPPVIVEMKYGSHRLVKPLRGGLRVRGRAG